MMSSTSGSSDLIVIGGGVIGLSIAWRARERDLSVTVLERAQTGAGTSRVAAGMLAPVSEVEFGEAGRRLLALGLRSAAAWPSFAEQLQAASGIDVGLLASGTLLLARDADESRELERQIAFRDSLGLRTERLRPSQAREREPAIAPALRLALEAPDDHSVDPRRVLAALRAACDATGVRVRERTPAIAVQSDAAGRATGVVVAGEAGDELVRGERVVLAAGAWSSQLQGVGDPVPVRPVRGQLLRLRDPSGPGLLRRVVRFGGGYLVPRGDGRYVLGGTVEERGFDVEPDVGGVYQLLRDARELLPGVDELKIEELCVGLRPGTPDNAPAIGRGEPAGTIWASGHHRNGVLLAPLTAELVVGLACDEDQDPALAVCSPRRFAQRPPAELEPPPGESFAAGAAGRARA